MRSTAFASLALSSLAFLSAANPEPCSDHPGVVHAPGEFDPVVKNVAKVLKLKVPSKFKTKSTKSSHKSSKAAVATAASQQKKVSKPTSTSSSLWHASTKAVKKKSTPKVKNASPQTVQKGASEVISSFQNASYVDPNVAKALQSAVSSAINAQLGAATTVTHTATSALLSTATQNVTRTEAHNGTTVYVPQPTTFVQTIYQNVTSVQTSTLITSEEALGAAMDIKKALEDAFAAVNLTQSGLDSATTASLEACLETVLASGGLPDGYSCLTSTGKDSAALTSTLNTILEQFVGILPNKILESVFDSVSPLLSTLLPSNEASLVSQIQSSIQSVIASLSGNSVTALEQISECYSEAIQQQGNSSSLACFTKSGGAYSTLQTATSGVLEQFVGVLPASLTTAVENILSYNVGNATDPSEQLAASVNAQISDAINSVASSLSGNTVTLAETLQKCATELISNGNATAAQECITQTSAPELSMTTINSIAQQFSGYLPSSFFTDLVTYSSTLLNSTSTNPNNLTQSTLNAAFESYFNNATSLGPAYVTCIVEVQECVTEAIKAGAGKEAVCRGPIKGCEAIKASASSSSSSSASSSASSSKLSTSTTSPSTKLATSTSAAVVKVVASSSSSSQTPASSSTSSSIRVSSSSSTTPASASSSSTTSTKAPSSTPGSNETRFVRHKRSTKSKFGFAGKIRAVKWRRV
ncbi:hypothetical protein JCM11641_006781 [Rhodosporidiobolus odoratus]